MAVNSEALVKFFSSLSGSQMQLFLAVFGYNSDASFPPASSPMPPTDAPASAPTGNATLNPTALATATK